MHLTTIDKKQGADRNNRVKEQDKEYLKVENSSTFTSVQKMRVITRSN